MLALLPLLACAPLALDPADTAGDTGVSDTADLDTASHFFAMPPHAEPLPLAPTDSAAPGLVGGAVGFEPDTPVADLDGLSCVVTSPFQSPQGLEVSTLVTWELDGEPMPEHDGRTSLESGELRSGETWRCTVTATDGSVEASARAQTTVASGPWDMDPWVHPEVWVTPADAGPGDTVTVHYAGDRDDPFVDYSFDGWWVGDRDEAYDDVGQRYFERAQLTQGIEHWRVSLVVPDDAASLDLRFGSGPEHDEREHHHDFVFPWVGPYLHFTPDVQPDDGVVVSWETATPSWGVVAWGTESPPRNLVRGEEWDTLHHVPLTGLPADSEIFYQVFAPDGRSSEVTSFRTPPADGAALRVLLLADMQDDGTEDELWGTIADHAATYYGDADLMLLPGDLAYSDHPGHWWRFWHRGRDLFARVPFVAAVGNHDTPGHASNADDQDSYLRWMDLEQPWQQVTYQGLRVLSLNSEDPADMQLGSEQLTWAAGALEESWEGDERVDDWVFAIWHHPPYDVGARFAGEASEYREATALFDGQVDWVVTGHEHIYQRFHPMRYAAELVGSYGTDDDQGVGYLVLPSAGNKTMTSVVDAQARGGDQRGMLAFPELEEGVNETPVAVGFAVADLTRHTMELTVWGFGTKGEPEAATVVEQFTQQRMRSR